MIYSQIELQSETNLIAYFDKFCQVNNMNPFTPVDLEKSRDNNLIA